VNKAVCEIGVMEFGLYARQRAKCAATVGLYRVFPKRCRLGTFSTSAYTVCLYEQVLASRTGWHERKTDC